MGLCAVTEMASAAVMMDSLRYVNGNVTEASAGVEVAARHRNHAKSPSIQMEPTGYQAGIKPVTALTSWRSTLLAWLSCAECCHVR